MKMEAIQMLGLIQAAKFRPGIVMYLVSEMTL